MTTTSMSPLTLPAYEMNVKVIESVLVGLTTSNFEGYNSFADTYSTIVFNQDTTFITGDLITYSVIGEEAVPLCSPGEYFVEVIPSDPRKIRLYLSPSFIGSASFVGLEFNDQPGTHAFTLESQKNRRVNAERSFKKIPIIGGTGESVTIDRPPSTVEPGGVAVLLTV